MCVSLSVSKSMQRGRLVGKGGKQGEKHGAEERGWWRLHADERDQSEKRAAVHGFPCLSPSLPSHFHPLESGG